MNDKISKDIALIIVCILLVVAAYSAVSTSRELGAVRSAYSELAERNRQLELANNELTKLLDASTERLSRVASRIADAQKQASGISDTISRIRILIGAIEAISQELRNPLTVSQP